MTNEDIESARPQLPPPPLAYLLRTKKFRLGLKGYNVDEVDAFLEALAIKVERGAALFPKDFLSNEFRIGLKGYDRQEVAAFLEGVEAAVGAQYKLSSRHALDADGSKNASDELIEAIRGLGFLPRSTGDLARKRGDWARKRGNLAQRPEYLARTVEFRLGLKGYNVDEVDEFLDALAQKLERGEALVPEDVTSHEFRLGLKGYNVDEVDEFLEYLVEISSTQSLDQGD